MIWLGASPVAPFAYVLSAETGLGCLDLKAKRYMPIVPQGGPASLVKAKSAALSRDGKYLCVQGADFMCHRYRVEGAQLKHEQSKASIAKAAILFQFSPDSKQVVMTYPNLNPIGAKKVSAVEVYPIAAWDQPTYKVPGYLRLAALDGRGGMYAVVDKEVRYYPEPAQNANFQALALPQLPRRMHAFPQAPVCLMVAPQVGYLVEPGEKN
jgi:hypothetical protein